MDMKAYNQMPEIKFMIVLGKMQSTVHHMTEKHLKEVGLNKTEFMIMYAIAVHGKLAIQDIGERISMTSGNMTYTIDKLEKKEWIRRERCPEDRRRIYVDFTGEGEVRWYEFMEEHARYMKELFGIFDEHILQDVTDLMKRIGHSLEEQ